MRTGDRRDERWPPRHLEIVRSTRRHCFWIVLIATLLTIGIVALAIWWNESISLAATAISIWFVIVYAAVVSLVIVHYDFRLILYFDRSVDQIETFMAGRAVVKSIFELDDLCRVAGVPFLSSFGFNDDLVGEVLEWHEAQDGLKTVVGLLEQIPHDIRFSRNRQALVADLLKWRYALERARDKDIRFCLLFYYGRSTSGHEWSLRRGTAF